MKKTLFVLILLEILLASCDQRRTNDYSLFPKGTVLFGKMKGGKTFYLIREDSEKMAGICFVDNNKAVVETMSFFSDSTGVVTFIFGNESHSGKMIVDPSTKQIELTLPKFPTVDIESQTIQLKHFDKISQNIECIECFKNPVFENIVAEKDLLYGTASGYYTSKPSDYISKDDYRLWFEEMFKSYRESVVEQGMLELPLYLDVYRPENSHLNKTPLLIFIHGGAFFFGDKENKLQQTLTDHLVKRGYTVVSINYRLGSTLLGKGAIERAIYRDVQDTRAALRFLVHHQEKLGIDTANIYLAGSSAGGIIALTTAFMDSDEVYASTNDGVLHLRKNLNGLDDSGNDLNNTFNVAGVVSLWGGVTNLQMLDNSIPTLLFHGTEDEIIPCDEGLPFKNVMGGFAHRIISSFGKLYGSKTIYNRLTVSNIPAKYVPFHGYGHDAHIESDETLNANMNIICEETANFLFDNVSKHYFNHHFSGNTSVGKNDSTPVYQLDNLGNASVQWQVDGGFITDQTPNSICVIWYSSHKTGTVTVCITNENGISCKKELNITINGTMV